MDLDLSDSDGETDDKTTGAAGVIAPAVAASSSTGSVAGLEHGGVMMFSPPSIASRMPPKVWAILEFKI